MKTFNSAVFCLFLTVFGAPAQTINTDPNQAGTTTVPPPTAPQIATTGANINVWQWQTYDLQADNQIATHNHSYTELASGLNYQDPSSGKWVPSQELIVPYAQGAIAQQGQHQVIFADNLNSAGAIDELTPDGKRLVSNIVGLMYHDPTTGQSVQIAQIQDSEGQLVVTNQILYTNAFDGVKADVLYTYRRDGMEQDVVLRAQLPTPESFGLNSATVELEVVTEFLNPPEASVWNVGMDSEGLEPDQAISWGATSLGHGRAFSLDGQDTPATVFKQYINVNGHSYLLEKVRFQEIQQALSSLPEQASNAHSLPGMASKRLELPRTPNARPTAHPIRQARGSDKGKGYVLDYTILNPGTTNSNFIFQGDTTYLITGPVNLSGTTYFEGNTVIKYTSLGSLVGAAGSQMIFLSAPYRPVVFTAVDDDNIGEAIPGSTGSPSGYYANPAISLGSTGSVALADFRIAYANRGLSVSGTSPAIYDAQFVNCAMAVSDVNGAVTLGNVLFSGVKTNFNATSSTNTISVANATFNNGFDLINGSFSNTKLYLTNCAFVNATNLSGNISAGYNGFYQSPEVGSSLVTNTVYPLQITGAASCYLTNGCNFLNAGTTNIDPNALKRIQVKTTWAPVVFNSYTISTATNLSIQAQRDTNSSPNLGYHYDPLDYAFGNSLASSNITFSAGTAAAWFYTSSGGTHGLALGDGTTVNFNGTPTSRCYWVRYNMVQEGFNGNWTARSYIGGMVIQTYTHAAPTARAQYTTFSTPNNEAGPYANSYGATYLFIFAANNCEFYTGGGGDAYVSVNVTNCLFVNGAPSISVNNNLANVTMQGCTCIRGNLYANHNTGSTWPITILNCAFDQTTFTLNPNGSATNGYYTDYNSFRSGFQTTTNLGGHEVFVTNSYNWQSGSLGNYYLPTNSPIIDKGNTNANLLGLYQFTTQTNQMKETNSIVDMGYHYVSTDANGNPLDSNGDGIPDYLEDANGDGLVDNGETNWALAILVQPANQTVIQGTNVSLSVTAAGVNPLNYQWYFGSSALAGQTASILTLNNVQPSNDGNYFVVVSNSICSLTSTIAGLTVDLLSSNCLSYGAAGYRYQVVNSNLVSVFYATNFDESSFTNGQAAFASTNNPDGCSYPYSTAVTFWHTNTDILLRRHFYITPGATNLNLGLAIDNDAQIYLNGIMITNAMTMYTNGTLTIQAFSTNGWYHHVGCATNDSLVLNGIPTNCWHGGDNLLAVRGRDLVLYLGQEDDSFADMRLTCWPFSTNSILSVQITSPTNQIFMTRTNVTVTAQVNNSSTNVVQWVEFFVETNAIGLVGSTNNLYHAIWPVTTGGTFTMTAVAQNTNGLNVWSPAVTNYVRNQPSVTITNPMNGTVFLMSPTNLTIQAIAQADASTIITNVTFYQDTNVIASTNSGIGNEYAIKWSATNGTYVLKAEAFDTNGGTGFSADVSITVATNQPPSVYAGPNQTINLSTNALQLYGVASDDGLPYGILSVNWTNLNGGTNVYFTISNQPATTAYFYATGAYYLVLSATDGQYTNSSTNLIAVLQQNTPPVVYVQTNLSLILPALPNTNQLQPLIYLQTLTNVPGLGGGIDYFAPSNCAIFSVYKDPTNAYLYLLPPNGIPMPFVTVSNATVGFENGSYEAYIATARDTTGGFKIGDTFFGNDIASDCEIVRIDPSGTNYWSSGAAGNAWVVLPSAGDLVHSLWVDDTGVWGGDLLVLCGNGDGGNIWRINSAGQASEVASNLSIHEGIITIPNDLNKYGPWASKVLASGDYDKIEAVDTNGNVSTYDIGFGAESIRRILPNENLLCLADQNTNIYGASADEFAQCVGDLLIANEEGSDTSYFYRAHWDGSQFEITRFNNNSQIWAQGNFTPEPLLGLATNYVALNGSVIDDGHLISPTSNTWTKVSGPGDVVIGDFLETNTYALFSEPGTNYLRLTAFDGQFYGYADSRIVVVRNQAPVVNAGTNQVVATTNAFLDGIVSDDGLPYGVTNIIWSVSDNPSGCSVLFSNANIAATIVSFRNTNGGSPYGRYVLRLTADDGQATSISEVTVIAGTTNITLTTVYGWATPTNTYYSLTGNVVDQYDNPVSNLLVQFTVIKNDYGDGSDTITNWSASTDTNGNITLVYTRTNVGEDLITATISAYVDGAPISATARKDWSQILTCGFVGNTYPYVYSPTFGGSTFANLYTVNVLAGLPFTVNYTNANHATLILRDLSQNVVAVGVDGILNYTPQETGGYLLEVTDPITNEIPKYSLSLACGVSYSGSAGIQVVTNSALIQNGGLIAFPSASSTGSREQFTLNIINPGVADLVISNVLPTGDFSTSGTNFDIPPGTSTNLTLQFNASSNGFATGSLTLLHNAPGFTNIYLLQGSVIGPQLQVLTNTTAYPYSVAVTYGGVIEFPTTSVGHPTNVMLVISNAGVANLIVSNLVVTGSFTNLSGTNFNIAAGTSTNLQIQFNASSNSFYGGMLTFSDNAGGGQFTAYLDGTAYPGGAPPTITFQYMSEYIQDGGIIHHGPTNVWMVTLADSSTLYVKYYYFSTNGFVFLGITNNPTPGSEFYSSVMWSNAPLGTFALTAIAVDSSGRIGQMQPITITIISNNPPVAADYELTVYADSFGNVFQPSFADPDNDPTVIVSNSTPVYGSASVTADQSHLNYVPPPGAYGSDQFTYTVSDGYGGFATANVFVTVVNPMTIVGQPQLTVLNDGTNVENGGSVEFPATVTNVPTTVSLFITNTGTLGLNISNILITGDFTNETAINIYIPVGQSTNLILAFNASSNEVCVGQITMQVNTALPTFGFYLLGSAFMPGTPPTVQLLSPSDGSTVFAPAAFSLTASASSSITNISFVDFQQVTTNGTIDFGEVTNGLSGTYTLNVANLTDGDYTFRAEAVDGVGRTVFSPIITIHVLPSNGDAGPTAVNDDITVFANSFNDVLNVLANDFNTNGYAMKIISVSRPGNGGTATIINGGGAISYTPAHGFSSTDASTGTVYPGDGFNYVISDGHGGTAQASVTIRVFATAPPQVAIISPTNNYPAAAGATVPIIAQVTPSQYITNVEFYLGDVLIGAATNSPTGLYTNFWFASYKDCDCLFTATAYDAFGQAGTSPGININVAQPWNGPGGTSSIGPVGSLVSYTAGTNASQSFTNLATIRDGIISLSGQAVHPLGSNVIWQLGVYSEDGQTLLRDLTPAPLTNVDYHAGTVGTTSISGILVSNCDLTTLANGVYIMRLAVIGGEMITNTDVFFILDSNLKIGQFSFSQQDIVIPVDGIPLTVTRTYNSLNPDNGDFGYSWTMSLNDMDVQLDETRQDISFGGATTAYDADSSDDSAGTLSMRSGGGWDVTLTLPDGRRTTFPYAFLPDGSDDSGFANNLVYSSQPGVTAQLSVSGQSAGAGDNEYNTLIYPLTSDWPPYWFKGGEGSTMDNYDLPGWVLQTLDGTKYNITRGDVRHITYDDGHLTATIFGPPKLTSIVEPSTDVIKIDDASISHWTGGTNLTHKISFDRDSNGHIIGIHDPNGNLAVKYEYDGYGNLFSVEKLTTAGTYTTNSYTYTNPNFPHYITGIFNGDGSQVAKNFYDDSGRLTETVDAEGNITQFIHNTTNNMEVMVDRLSRTNTYVYDLHGDVTDETNALGGVTHNAYDSTNNLLSVTDPLGYTTSYQYDLNGNRTQMVDALSHTNSFLYDTNGNLTVQTDPLGNVTASLYDGANNLTNTVQTDPFSNVFAQSSSIYVNNQLSATLDANGNTTASFTYDSSGNVATTTDSRGFTRSFSYDANGNQTSSSYTWTPPGGSPVTVNTYTFYDDQDRPITTIDADGNTNQTVYNANGKVAYTIDKFGNTNSFIYDARGNTIQTTYADGTQTSTVYDNDGKVILTSDRNQMTGTLTQYDPIGRATNTIRMMGVVINITPDLSNPGDSMSVIGSQGTGYSTNSTAYLANGWVLSRTGPDGETTTYDYYADGQVKDMIDPLGHTNSYQYDAGGHKTVSTDALSHTVQFQYDAVGRLKTTLFNNSTTTTNLFNNVGQRVGEVDQATLTTQFGYDVSGQLTNVIKPIVLDPQNGNATSNPAWSYQYDMYGRLVVSTDAKGRTNTFTYDAQGRQLTHRLPMGGTETNVYTTNGVIGLLWKQYDFKGQHTEFVYDKLGRVKARFLIQAGAVIPDEAVCYVYNQLGQVSETVERYGADATTNACDGYASIVGLPKDNSGLFASLMASVNRYPNVSGGLTGLTLLGMAIVMIPARKRRQIRELALEIYDEQMEAFWALAGRVSPVRGHRRRLKLPSHGWRFATLITLAALIANEPGVDQLWTAHAQCFYPPNTSTPTTRLTFYTYDLDGRLTQVNAPEGVINYGYDLATGRHISTCTANSELSYGYDALGRLQTVIVLKRNGQMLSPSETTTYHYDAVGNRSELDLPNGVVTTYRYDTLNRLTNLVHQAGMTNLAAYSYKLDATGRRTNAVEVLWQEGGTYLTNTLSWQFDGLYRLTNEVAWCSATGYSYTNGFVYDLDGNRLQQIRTGGSAETITSHYDLNDQLTNEVSSISGTTSYAYDGNGSVTGKTNSSGTLTYTYNVANKLNGVLLGGVPKASYLYNDQGIRVSATANGSTTHYLIDANNHTGYAQVMEELLAVGGTPSTSYTIGDEVLAQCGTTATAPSYFLQDGHGNNRQLAQMNGTVTSHYSYEAYGAVLGTSTSSSADAAVGSGITSKLFCGEQYDATLHMYNLRARYYDSSNGRFNQRDTFAGNNDDPQTLHKYLYANCDSVNESDPTGKFPEILITIAIIVIAVIVIAIIGDMLRDLLEDRWVGRKPAPAEAKALKDARDWITANQTNLPPQLVKYAKIAVTANIRVVKLRYGSQDVWGQTDTYGNFFGNNIRIDPAAFKIDKRLLAILLIHESVHTTEWSLSGEKRAYQAQSDAIHAWHLESATNFKNEYYNNDFIEISKEGFQENQVDNPAW